MFKRELLFPHQLEAAKYLIDNFGGCLWMEMRTGKTLPTLLAIADLELYPTLVVAPAHTFRGWEDQIVMAEGNLANTQRLTGTAKKINKMIANPKAINFMNYSQTWRRDVLNQQDWKAIILDESIRIGNLDTAVTDYFFKNARSNPNAFKACLSGSPMSENLIQIIPQKFWQRNGEVFGYVGGKGFDEYMEKNWVFRANRNQWMPGSIKHRRELLGWNQKTSYTCSMADIGRGSVLCHRVSRVVPSPDMVRRINSLRVGKLYQSITLCRPVPLNPLSKAGFEMSLCAGRDPFTREVFDTKKQAHILDEWDKQEKIPFIVFGFLKDPLKVMVPMFEKMGGKCGYIDADVKNSEQIIADFQAGKLDAIFAQAGSIMEGVTLDRADKIFYLNNYFSQNVRNQSKMRGTSMNKKYPVEIIDVVYEGCYEEHVVGKLDKKEENSTEMFKKDYIKIYENTLLISNG
ncbi:MAG: SNF2-related protein [Planctomycetota bacterium]|jgi:hypothetical protein